MAGPTCQDCNCLLAWLLRRSPNPGALTATTLEGTRGSCSRQGVGRASPSTSSARWSRGDGCFGNAFQQWQDFLDIWDLLVSDQKCMDFRGLPPFFHIISDHVLWEVTTVHCMPSTTSSSVSIPRETLQWWWPPSLPTFPMASEMYSTGTFSRTRRHSSYLSNSFLSLIHGVALFFKASTAVVTAVSNPRRIRWIQHLRRDVSDPFTDDEAESKTVCGRCTVTWVISLVLEATSDTNLAPAFQNGLPIRFLLRWSPHHLWSRVNQVIFQEPHCVLLGAQRNFHCIC